MSDSTQTADQRVAAVGREGVLGIERRPVVEPGFGEVRIRVEACGICHTDSASVGPHAHGRIPGHEIAGRIDVLGAGVEGWERGQRVGLGFLGGHCGQCEQCRRGNFVYCSNQPFVGMTGDGGYAESVIARSSGLVAVPDGLTAVEAAPLLCAGFTVYNALCKADVQPEELVAVQGIGGLGHLALQYARAMGHRVVAIARGQEKEALSRELGADDYVDSTASDAVERLQALGGVDVVVSTVSGGTASGLIPALNPGGRLVIVGASDEPVQVPPSSLLFNDVRVIGSLTGSSVENEDNLRFAVRHGIRALSETRPLEDAADAYDRMLSGKARFRMVLDLA
ncbi:zinc-binding dehydrogenase [Streptomyces massasporeus]|uniref:zinc-binding dehydrogenase n=1 Tax=Streptomyces massasporeus TaxID=67324 RepID=UPI0037AFE283